MEQNQSPTSVVQSLPSQQPKIITEEPQRSYLSRLFSGRVNRQNYIFGSTFFVLVPLLCFTVVIFNILLSPDIFAMSYLDPNNPTNIITPHISIISLLTTPANEVWSILGIIFFVISFPYVFSLQIRRLHDLNLSGWFWVVNFGSLLPLYSMFTSGLFSAKPDAFFWIAELISLIASFFSLYVSMWPGTNGLNKYGDKPAARTNLLSDILQVK